MRRLLSLALAAGLLGPTLLQAADLAKIERTIAKPPVLQTKSPRYCLLVCGPQGEGRAWLVVDGPKLYLDKNGDGDLTQAGEAHEALRDPETKQEPEPQGYREFAGEVQIAGERDAGGKPVVYRVELAMLGEAGSYVTIKSPGRAQVAFPQFASRAADAPVIHVGGPLEILLSDSQLVRGKKGTDLRVQVATPGIGKDAAAALANDELDPAIRPELEIEFPAQEAGGSPIRQKLVLADRCCGSLFHGPVPIPAEAGDGKARLTIRFPAWKEGPPARTFELPLADKK